MEVIIQNVNDKRTKAQNLLNWPELEHAVFARHFWFLYKDTNNALAVAQNVCRLQNSRIWRNYSHQVRSLAWNIRHCPHAVHWKRDNDTTQWLANLDDVRTLWPERWANIIDTRFVDSQDARKSLVTESGTFKCYKCKGRFIEYYQMQTRSADEPATNFFHCVTCNVRWRTN